MDPIEMISIDWFVSERHAYRKFRKVWSFTLAERRLKKMEKDNPHKGFGLLRSI